MQPLAIADALVEALAPLSFGPPVSHVYNPLVYARAPHAEYLERYARPGVEAVLIGMNPGPFGMAQTGVPFGDVVMVRDWLGIVAPVGEPPAMHEKRPVLGFANKRREVSGSRLWGWARETFGTPEAFFARFFVANYCPLCFMDTEGRNVIPEKLAPADRAPLYAACDRALGDLLQFLKPAHVIGVGAFAAARAARVGRPLLVQARFGSVLHPSPASPKANRGWSAAATRELQALGIALPAAG